MEHPGNEGFFFPLFPLAFEFAQAVAGFPMLRIDLEDLLIERNRARGELHRLKEFRKLKVRRGVPRIQFDGFLELADRFLPVLRHRRQAPRQNCMVLRHVRLELHALAQPQNRPRKIVTAQALLGPGEAFVHGFLAFGLALAESEGTPSASGAGMATSGSFSAPALCGTLTTIPKTINA